MESFLNKPLLFDGAMGTMLQRSGLEPGALPERLNTERPEIVRAVHVAYVEAGADVITTNTFGANSLKLKGECETRAAILAAVRLAREAGAKRVALDIGPIGALLAPIGALSFDEAYSLFAEQIKAGAEAGADMVLIETMSDILEAKAAILAAKENCALPILATMTFAQNGRTFLGADAKTAAIALSSLGVSAVGANCSLGPAAMLPVAREFIEYSPVPVLIQANAGLPELVSGESVYLTGPEEYAGFAKELLAMGVSMIGGCCGTGPEHIRAMRALMDEYPPTPREPKRYTAFTSGQRTVMLGSGPAIIGERINPTGKKRLQAALRAGDYAYACAEAIAQQEHGADILDVNAGLPDICEKEVLCALVREVQAVTPLPLQIDSADSAAIEAALRIYSGKPIINSVNGKEESLSSILPLAAKYGAAVVALTLDEHGIPESAKARLDIARRILGRAEMLGIPREDIIVDCLTLSAASNQGEVMETLRAVTLVKQELGLSTVLGVSNVSFGLPAREAVNCAFLAMAFQAGLDMPILNPLSEGYMRMVRAYRVLSGADADAADFIAAFGEQGPAPAMAAAPEKATLTDPAEELRRAIIHGQRGLAREKTRELLESSAPLDIIDGCFIPSLDVIGARFDKGEAFLPQLMASAEAVKDGFSLIKERMGSAAAAGKGPVILATVKGDIHDIGKNIVRMLLENYGYAVVDLGRDVPPERVVSAAVKERARLVGLSALMTTTVPAMKETIEALRAAGSEAAVMVGGAVLTEDYARMVGADFYAKDASEAVKISNSIFRETKAQ